MSVQTPPRHGVRPPTSADDAGDDRPGVVLVTGAAGGIGRAVVGALLRDGGRVIATDLSDAEAELGTLGALATAALDVRDGLAIDELVAEVERDHGPIDGLVCAHGLLAAGPALTQADEDWALLHDVNAAGVMRVCRAVTRRMATRQRGAVVVIGSNAAAVARDGLSAYASSKAAARHYTLCLGVELAPLGIRCNVVSPGSTDTPMLHGAWAGGGDQDPDLPRDGTLGGAASRRAIAGTPEAFWPGIPMGRVAQPEWIADAVAFLLSPQARHIALHDLRVDGGATLGA